jgi:hypothetical protein
MTFTATAIVVLVASPGDTADERAAIQLALSRWNVDRGEREAAVVVPWLYEQHAVPALGSYAQSIINSQAVDRADVVVAFFDARLGTETPEAVSGTAEEIKRAHEAGKPVHVYFSNEPVARQDVDVEQLAALASFKSELKAMGLLGSYENPLHLASQVVSAIDYDVNARDWGSTVRAGTPTGAVLKARHDHQREASGTDSKGKIKYRTITNDLIILNDGDATAEKINLTVDAMGSVIHFEEPEPFDLTRGSEVAFPLIRLDGSANVKVQMHWTEEDQERNFTQTVRVT